MVRGKATPDGLFFARVILLKLFLENLLPVYLIAGAGYLLGARGALNPRPLAAIAFSLFSPCLVYKSIVDTGLAAGSFFRMAGFTVISLALLGVLAALIARWLSCPRPLSAAMVLVVLLPNAGNFGLAANLLAFGDSGLAQASLFFVTSSIISFTGGVCVASLGRRGFVSSLLGLFKVPALWGVAAGFLVVRTEVSLPGPVDRAIRLLADASIPVFLVVLGLQLRGANWISHRGPLAAVAALRLLGGIATALLLTQVFGLEGTARQAAVLQSAMPSAVVCIILATEYEAEPGFVTAAVFITTLLSPLTLTPLLAYLTG